MAATIFRFDLNGKKVLGFDTGLDAQAFAQAKMSQFITQNGFLVYPNGKIEPWKALGVNERAGQKSMVIWGPDFPDVSLDTVVRNSEAGESLDAVRHYLNACRILESGSQIYPGAAGALVCMENRNDFPKGTILFPPERLVKRCIEAQGDDEIIRAQQWVHPDLKGDGQFAFSTAAMLYQILTGEAPFPPKDGDTLRQDIREGIFVPLRLAAPGLDRELASLITAALTPEKKNENKRPASGQISDALGTWKTGSLFSSLEETEKQKRLAEKEEYKKKRDRSVKTRRFVIRNTAVIMICLVLAAGAGLTIRGYLQHLAELPTTKGMTPIEVAKAYYGSFETMNHELMEACVLGKEAKIDLDMIINIYVITRTRQAYESLSAVNISAQEWLDKGSPQTDLTVFGITDLSLKSLRENPEAGEVTVEAQYKLWMPAAFAGEEDNMPSDEEILSGNYVNPPPKSYAYTDTLTFSLEKDKWRITEINRAFRG